MCLLMTGAGTANEQLLRMLCCFAFCMSLEESRLEDEFANVLQYLGRSSQRKYENWSSLASLEEGQIYQYRSSAEELLCLQFQRFPLAS